MSNPTKMLPYMHQFKLNGNTIDDTWYKIIRWKKTGKKPEGRPHLEAITLLSDIFFWYTPTINDNEDGTFSLTKKFKADILQRSYKQIEEKFGLTYRESKSALKTLENLGIIKVEFRNVLHQGKIYSDVMFINFNPIKLKKLMTKILKKSLGGCVRTQGGGAFKRRHTYTSLHKEKKKGSDSPKENHMSEEDLTYYKIIAKAEELFWISNGDKWDFVAEYGRSIVSEVFHAHFHKFPCLQKGKFPDKLTRNPRAIFISECEKEKKRRQNGKPENA